MEKFKQKENPFENILSDIEQELLSSVDYSPEKSTDAKLVYHSKDNIENFLDGLGKRKLRQALEDQMVTITTEKLSDLRIEELSETELAMATNPKRETVYRHTISLII